MFEGEERERERSVERESREGILGAEDLSTSIPAEEGGADEEEVL